MQLDVIYNEDCLTGLTKIPDESIDMVFSDLPYGTTKNSWDIKIPLHDYIVLNGKVLDEPQFMIEQYKKGIDYHISKNIFDKQKQIGLWPHLERIIKPNGVIALWAQAPFSHELAMSSPLFRYEWIIEKTKGTGHQNAKKMPMKCHESVLIFYKHLPTYNPQKTIGHSPVHNYTKHTDNGSNYGKSKIGISGGGSTERYPRDVLKFKWDTQTSNLHPTQKPMDACKYFIKTYTNENDIVLDVAAGSCTTAIAAKELKRHYICFEKELSYCDIGMKRITQEACVL